MFLRGSFKSIFNNFFRTVAPESGEEKSQSEEDSDIDNEGVDTGSKRKMKKKSSSSKCV